MAMNSRDMRDSKIERARQLRGAGDLEGAVAFYRELLERDPQDAEVMYFIGMTCWLQKNTQEAGEWIQRAIKDGYATDSVWYNYGLLLHETGEYARAIDAWRQALELNPGLPDVHCNMGLAFKELGENEAAIDSLRKEIEHNPEHAGAMLNLARVLVLQEELDAAEQCYRRLYDADPDSEEITLALAGIARHKGRIDEAIHFYDCARAIAREHPPYYYYTLIAHTLDEYGVYDRLSGESTFSQTIDTEQPRIEWLRPINKNASCNIVFFMVGDQIRPYADVMTSSALVASSGSVNFIQLSDKTTNPVPVATGIIRAEVGKDELMYLRQRLYASYMQTAEHDSVLLDTDIMLQIDPASIFGDWDVGLTLRGEAESINMRKIIPFNEGVIFCRATEGARRFWSALLHVYEQLPHCLRRWSGGQISLGILLRKYLESQEGDLLDVHGIRIKLLPKEIYNYAPESEDEDLSGRAIVHYHGPRKAWMLKRKDSL